MDMVVLAHIKEQSRLSLGSYGRPRMTEELKKVGVAVGHRRVGRSMGENGIVVERTRKFKATTDSDHTFNIAPNLLDRDFTADRPNQKWPHGGANTAYRLTGRRFQLCLDPRGLAVSRRHPRSAFAALAMVLEPVAHHGSTSAGPSATA